MVFSFMRQPPLVRLILLYQQTSELAIAQTGKAAGISGGRQSDRQYFQEPHRSSAAQGGNTDGIPAAVAVVQAVERISFRLD